ncbi:MAG: SGNH/GDSL hydrolase family protein [Nitrospira sp.]|nr:SGNH/GDSL hydrolase family protein [Nitrospira sp.]
MHTKITGSLVLATCVLAGIVLWGLGVSSIRHLVADLLAIYFVLWALYAFLSGRKQSELRTSFCVTSFTLAICLGALEAPAFFGALDYRRVFSTSMNPVYQRGNVFDGELLWRRQPHFQLNMTSIYDGMIGQYICLPSIAPVSYNLRYDQHGFRNDQDLETADIAVIGDSFVEGVGIESSGILTTVLQSLEGRTVVNLGSSGYGPQQELVVLKRYATKFHPKTIVWMFYEGNDLKDVRAYEQGLAGLHEELRYSERAFITNALMTVMRLWRGCVPDEHLKKRYGKIVDKEGRQRKIYFPEDTRPLHGDRLAALQTASSVLAAAYQYSREEGIRLVLVFAPEHYRVYSGLSTLVEVSDEVKWWSVNDFPERLRTVVKSISPDFEYFDLTPTLRMEAAKGTSLYISNDTHWTAEGHKIVAEALHKALARKL